MDSKFFSPERPRIFAHRGSSIDAPENSMLAFSTALLASPYIETDLYATRDGVLLFHHDADLLRSCGKSVHLSDLNYEDVRELNIFGSDQKIPRVEEALEIFPNAFWNIEIKDPRPGVEEAIIKTIRKTGTHDRVLIAAENDAIMKRFRALKSGIPTSASHFEMLAIIQWLMAGAQGSKEVEARAFQLPVEHNGLRLDRPELIAFAHRIGVEVHYWTINQPSEAKRLLDLGADGIVTDDPHLISKSVWTTQSQSL